MTKAKTAVQANEQSEREQYEEQVFLSVFANVKEGKSAIGEEMAEINEAYKRLKPVGFTKGDIKFAFELEDEDAAKVIATMQRRIRIAKMFGHGLARQVELFEDRAPIEERAYDEGLAAGKLRKPDATNPYGMDSAAGQAWQRGMNDGTAFANKDLAPLFEERPDVIKGGDSEDPFADAA